MIKRIYHDKINLSLRDKFIIIKRIYHIMTYYNKYIIL